MHLITNSRAATPTRSRLGCTYCLPGFAINRRLLLINFFYEIAGEVPQHANDSSSSGGGGKHGAYLRRPSSEECAWWYLKPCIIFILRSTTQYTRLPVQYDAEQRHEYNVDLDCSVSVLFFPNRALVIQLILLHPLLFGMKQRNINVQQ